MAQFGITKIMDGLFITDSSLLYNFDFLIGNKVSHVVIWDFDDQSNKISEQCIKVIKYQKNDPEGMLPQIPDIQRMHQFIEESQQQYMCCMICSDIQSQAGMLLSSYIMNKFQWDLETVFNFIQLRFNFFSPRVEIVEQLQDFQLYLQDGPQPRSLKSIQFSSQFLSSYQTQNQQEKLVLNTIKNMMFQRLQPKKMNNRRKRRVQWFDRLRPTSSLTSFNCKYAVYNRNSSLKPKKVDKQTLKPYSIAFQQQSKPRILKRSSDLISNGQFFMDDLQFQSLKDLTKTKSNQNNRFKCSLRKRSSLQLVKQDRPFKQNIQGNVHTLKKRAQAQFKELDSSNFLKNLKNLSKLKLSSAGFNT